MAGTTDVESTVFGGQKNDPVTIHARRSDARLKTFVHYAALVIMALFCVGLIAVMFVTSFKTQVQTFNTWPHIFLRTNDGELSRCDL